MDNNVALKVKVLTSFEDDLVCSNIGCIYYIQKGRITEFYNLASK